MPTKTISPSARRQPGSLLLGTAFGACLVAAGLCLAFLALATPLVASLVPGGRSGTIHVALGLGIWALALVAGGGFLVSGTNRLAAIVAAIRSPSRGHSPVAAALGVLPPDVYVASNVVLSAGRPIPEIVVGPFGVAVVHELGRPNVIRQTGTTWERKTGEGWLPTEHPLDRVERDAERIRHWLTHGDLDFVVRVYAALITADTSMMRSPLCAVITEDRIPDWIAALPRQRTLSDGRREQIAGRVRAAVPN
ncbi:MAG: hypothetical protein ACJ779_06165 [Chloroflexota bacterium]